MTQPSRLLTSLVLATVTSCVEVVTPDAYPIDNATIEMPVDVRVATAYWNLAVAQRKQNECADSCSEKLKLRLYINGKPAISGDNYVYLFPDTSFDFTLAPGVYQLALQLPNGTLHQLGESMELEPAERYLALGYGTVDDTRSMFKQVATSSQPQQSVWNLLITEQDLHIEECDADHSSCDRVATVAANDHWVGRAGTTERPLRVLGPAGPATLGVGASSLYYAVYSRAQDDPDCPGCEGAGLYPDSGP